MLEQQGTIIWHYMRFPIHTPLHGIMKRCKRELDYLVCAEDTTESYELEQKDMVKNEGYNARGTIKVMFWLVASIATSLLLGQLK